MTAHTKGRSPPYPNLWFIVWLVSDYDDHVSGNYSCYDGGGCANDTAMTPFSGMLDSFTVGLLSQLCLPSVLNHPYFHFSHAIMFICYMLPFGSPCQLILLIRIGLAGATTIMALWARNVQCWLDSLLWNAASAVVNVVHILVLFYQLRPIKFNDELELVNTLNLFSSLKGSSTLFVISLMQSQHKKLCLAEPTVCF